MAHTGRVQLGSKERMAVGVNDLEGLFQPKAFYDSMVKTEPEIKQAQKLTIADQPRRSSVDISILAVKHLSISLL